MNDKQVHKLQHSSYYSVPAVWLHGLTLQNCTIAVELHVHVVQDIVTIYMYMHVNV